MKKITVLVFSTVMLMILTQTSAFACGCVTIGNPTIEQRVKNKLAGSAVAFRGEVIKIEPQTDGHSYHVKFSVAEYWKGKQHAELTLITRDSSCQYPFEAGEKYLVYAYIREDVLTTNVCIGNLKLENAKEELKVLGKGEKPSIIQQDWDAPTIVSLGQATGKDRAYSKKIEHNSDPRGKVSESIKLADQSGYQGIIEINEVSDFNTGFQRLPPNGFLQFLTCGSDTVVFGSPINKAGHLTDDETYIYTEYDFSVKAVLKSNPGEQVVTGNIIQIARPGGFIKVDNHVFRVNKDAFQPLLKNRDYLLSLRSVPEAKGYVTSNVLGDFILEDNKFKPPFDSPIPSALRVGTNFQNLLDNISQAAAQGCNFK